VIYGSVAKAGAREQPITRHFPEILEAYLAAAEGDQQWLFPARRSLTGHTMNIEKPFRRVVAAAGLDVRQVCVILSATRPSRTSCRQASTCRPSSGSTDKASGALLAEMTGGGVNDMAGIIPNQWVLSMIQGDNRR
jgi:hypothetical protein